MLRLAHAHADVIAEAGPGVVADHDALLCQALLQLLGITTLHLCTDKRQERLSINA